MKIHISQATADLLEGTDFVVKKREGEVTVKVSTINIYMYTALLVCAYVHMYT